MLGETNFIYSEESKLFLCSDTHFRHNKPFIYEPRNYNTVKEHDEGIIKIWNERVGISDNVLFLGDFIVGAGSDNICTAFNEIVWRLNGHIFMIYGNHNAQVKSIYLNELRDQYGVAFNKEVYPLTWKEKVTFLGSYIHGKVRVRTAWQKRTVQYSAQHFPAAVWLDMGHDTVYLCGHSHGSYQLSLPTHLTHKILDCGVDIFGGPVDFLEAMKILDKKKFEQVDRHNDKTNPS